MIQAEAQRALEDAVGEGGLESHAPVPLDGSELAWTARPADPEALADAILRLLDDSELGQAMGVRGRERSRQYFSWEVIARETATLYERAIADSGRNS